MTKDEFREISEVWAELKAIYDEIDDLNNAAQTKGIDSLGTAAYTASAH